MAHPVRLAALAQGKLAVLAVMLATVVLSGQQVQPPPQPPQSQQPQQPPTFRTSLETVRVDATVVDSNGKPIKTLTADDFALEEDGAPQRIDQFKLLELNGHPPEGDETSLAVTSRGHAATEVAREDVRVFVVFWDDYHISQLSVTRLRDALKKFLRDGLGPTDMVAVMTQWTPASDIRFRRDHDDMAMDVDKLEGRRGNYMPRNGAEENHMSAMKNIELVRSQVSATALRAAIAHLGAIREGRKAILYFSQEFGLGRETSSAAMALIQSANDANVAIYGVNPDGLRVERSRFGIISDVAHNTGGESLQTNSLDFAIARAVSQSSATYLLGYSPSPVRHDGKFHKISVRVKPRGLHVRARNGYWAPHPGAVKRAMEEASRVPSTSAPVMKAFGELAGLTKSALDDSPRIVRTILAPDPPLASLAVQAPAVWSVRRPADLLAVLGSAPPAPIEGREFSRVERLILRVEITGTDAADAVTVARLVGKGGNKLTDLPLTRISPDVNQWRIDLPLAVVARGDYVIAIEANHGAARAFAYVPIRITGG